MGMVCCNINGSDYKIKYMPKVKVQVNFIDGNINNEWLEFNFELLTSKKLPESDKLYLIDEENKIEVDVLEMEQNNNIVSVKPSCAIFHTL
jgi:type II restriction/modification system DNA methylase subunit YeeA